MSSHSVKQRKRLTPDPLSHTAASECAHVATIAHARVFWKSFNTIVRSIVTAICARFLDPIQYQIPCRARLSAHPAAAPLLPVRPCAPRRSALLGRVAARCLSRALYCTQVCDTARSVRTSCPARLPHAGDHSPRQRAARNAATGPTRALTATSSAALTLTPLRRWPAPSKIRMSYPPCAPYHYTGTAQPAYVNMVGLVLVESCRHAVTMVNASGERKLDRL